MKLVWLTDLHFNFVSQARMEDFLKELKNLQAGALLMTGDLGEAETVVDYLRHFALAETPLHFVLGNHDYYHGSIATVREQVALAAQEAPWLNYLTTAKEPVAFNSWLGLIGHDGYGDARAGNFLTSGIRMLDYDQIEDLKDFHGPDLQKKLQQLGEEAAEHLATQLQLAIAEFRHIMLLMHVPPYQNATWYEGQVSDDEWAPHFTCQAVGDRLTEIMRHHPDKNLTVLCGHTHNRGCHFPLPNIQVRSGGAEYMQPTWTDVWEVAD